MGGTTAIENKSPALDLLWAYAKVLHTYSLMSSAPTQGRTLIPARFGVILVIAVRQLVHPEPDPLFWI
ncbi:uncharacterized protein PHALS_15192 [Plasmopara halstedii]|uniref:Uncharacterized protein n=1 Tax=Plasmopara halstedii TaxID=4781 RepID=A0A0P1B431_PLAHL|nr:uncharacterized protein PHALS_15192 [Plasmopara halstedii]CEG49097.1 hypothetical protein PHALS_15192 [Plasmopara halstedii]|eukprot:XP_024585466.1 hypothetical protein PHALS_15192 [Plasmopara halstedii]